MNTIECPRCCAIIEYEDTEEAELTCQECGGLVELPTEESVEQAT